jgi:kynurenine 3-monooxygenase
MKKNNAPLQLEGSGEAAIVVGAGLVGSLWAVFLARRGYTVKVFERRSDMRAAGYAGGRSINLAMSERGWKAIEQAGIREKIEKVAIPMPGRMMHSTSGELTFQAYGKEGEAIYSVSRGGLNLELLNIAASFPNVEFFFDHRCADVDLNNPTITFEDLKTKELKTIDAPLIFVAPSHQFPKFSNRFRVLGTQGINTTPNGKI